MTVLGSVPGMLLRFADREIIMTKRIILLGLVSGLLVSSTGCGLFRCLLCPGSMCDPQHCAPMPGPACGPASVAACQPACGPPSPPPCQPACGPVLAPACGPVSAPTCNQPYGSPQAPCGPLTWIFRLFGAGSWYGGGCGEMYYGDWCSAPPDCCDPCDQRGNYTGGGASGYYGGYTPGTAPQRIRVDPAPEVIQPPEGIRQ